MKLEEIRALYEKSRTSWEGQMRLNAISRALLPLLLDVAEAATARCAAAFPDSREFEHERLSKALDALEDFTP